MWAQIINTLVGLWLMASPAVLGYSDPAATNNDHIVGPVIATFAIIAYWEATRGVGKWNVALGLWLLLAPWILSFEDNTAIFNDLISGAIVVIFSVVKTRIEQQFGGGWKSLFRKNPIHQQLADKREQGNP